MKVKICNIFVSIYNKLKGESMNYRNESNYKTDFAFLNYWVNWKINTYFYQNNSVSYFYNHIDSQNLLETTYDVSDDLIYDIDKEELNKMIKLYNLYEKYSKLKSIIDDITNLNKESLLTLSSACCPAYIETNYMCNDGIDDDNSNNSQFCIELRKFRTKHEGLYKKVHTEKNELSDNFIRLSECRDTKIITNALIGSMVGIIPLFGVLYKFTPMGQVLRSKIGILNNDISNNDEEMTKMSLMEQENEQLKFQQGRYNIKYQSV
ncbi:PIR protein [Plasmodium vivax]|uniref:VIR protein n=1 Tax=Plasmodium vivax TaxID=5855 RepID=A0A565A4U7_PLAVI|nr:PIR protein [Plasmodium vivax]